MTGDDPDPERALSVLIVDDSDADRLLLGMLFDQAGLASRVVQADSVASGIAALQRESFDCALLDYVLPDGDGLAILDSLRARSLPTPPALLVSGTPGERLVAEARTRGASHCLSKDELTAESLREAIVAAIAADAG